MIANQIFFCAVECCLKAEQYLKKATEDLSKAPVGTLTAQGEDFMFFF